MTNALHITAATEPTKAARVFLNYCLDNGVRVWIRYGQTEIEGWVLSVSRHMTDVQDASTGAIQTIALSAITESVEV